LQAQPLFDIEFAFPLIEKAVIGAPIPPLKLPISQITGQNTWDG